MGRESETKSEKFPLTTEGDSFPKQTEKKEITAINTTINTTDNTDKKRGVNGINGIIIHYNGNNGEIIQGILYHKNVKTGNVDEVGEKGVKQRVAHYTKQVNLYKESLLDLQKAENVTDDELQKMKTVLGNNEGWLNYWTTALNEIELQKKIMEITDETVHNLA